MEGQESEDSMEQELIKKDSSTEDQGSGENSTNQKLEKQGSSADGKEASQETSSEENANKEHSMEGKKEHGSRDDPSDNTSLDSNAAVNASSEKVISSDNVLRLKLMLDRLNKYVDPHYVPQHTTKTYSDRKRHFRKAHRYQSATFKQFRQPVPEYDAGHSRTQEASQSLPEVFVEDEAKAYAMPLRGPNDSTANWEDALVDHYEKLQSIFLRKSADELVKFERLGVSHDEYMKKCGDMVLKDIPKLQELVPQIAKALSTGVETILIYLEVTLATICAIFTEKEKKLVRSETGEDVASLSFDSQLEEEATMGDVESTTSASNYDTYSPPIQNVYYNDVMTPNSLEEFSYFEQYDQAAATDVSDPSGAPNVLDSRIDVAQEVQGLHISHDQAAAKSMTPPAEVLQDEDISDSPRCDEIPSKPGQSSSPRTEPKGMGGESSSKLRFQMPPRVRVYEYQRLEYPKFETSSQFASSGSDTTQAKGAGIREGKAEGQELAEDVKVKMEERQQDEEILQEPDIVVMAEQEDEESDESLQQVEMRRQRQAEDLRLWREQREERRLIREEERRLRDQNNDTSSGFNTKSASPASDFPPDEEWI